MIIMEKNQNNIQLNEDDFKRLVDAASNQFTLNEKYSALFSNDGKHENNIGYHLIRHLPVPHTFIQNGCFIWEKQDITCLSCGYEMETVPREIWRDYYKCPQCHQDTGFPVYSVHFDKDSIPRILFSKKRLFTLANVSSSRLPAIFTNIYGNDGSVNDIFAFNLSQRKDKPRLEYILSVEVEKKFDLPPITWSNPAIAMAQ